MKKIRKFGILVGMMSMMAMSLAGCGKKRECEICGTKAKCKKFEAEGESAWLCSDCYSLVDSLYNMSF